MRTIKHFKGIPVVLSSPAKLGRIKDGQCTARVGMIEFHSLHKAKQFINALTNKSSLS